MTVPVDIYLMDESVTPVAIEGANVAVYLPNTHTLVASAVSDSVGKASFLLPGSGDPGTSYEVRFFKMGVNFHGLKTIQVLEPATSVNKFDHTGADSTVLDVSGSPNLCRCTGIFTDVRGQPMSDKSVRFVARGNTGDRTPKVWDIPSKIVGTDYLEQRTDPNGKIAINLIRNSEMLVSWGGDEDQVYCIHVPDRDSVNLIDLIHPFPVSITWDVTLAPGNAVSVQVGNFVEIPVVLTKTDYSTDSNNISEFFEFMNSDGSIVEATYDANRGLMVLRGIQSGTATVSPELKTGLLPNRWPIPSVVVPTLSVTVTP